MPVLTLDGYAAMPLHMNAFPVVSEQQRGAFASEDGLSAGGADSISTKKRRKKKTAVGQILSAFWSQRPLHSPEKPGAGFDMSQECAGECAGAAEHLRRIEYI